MRKLLRKCWAEPLGDCKGSLTREHVFAEGVLNGMLKIRRGNKIIPSSAVTVNYLCEYHNNVVLSDIDMEAGKYFNTVFAMMGIPELEERWKPEDPKNVIINGWKLERWFAKTLVNMVAGQVGYDPNGPEVGVFFQEGFREYVFGKSASPPSYPFGLWMIPPPIKYQKNGMLISHVHMDEFYTYNGKWSDKRRNPLYVVFQVSGFYNMHFGMFNLSGLKERTIKDDDLNRIFGVNVDKRFYRPEKIGFSLNNSANGDEPDNIITFDWSTDNAIS